jgi:hypothetical protein
MKKVARSLLLLGFVLSQGCTYVPGVEPTDIEPIRTKVATRAETEAILGEPEETLQTNVGVINIYSYDAGADGNFEGVAFEGPSSGRRGLEETLVFYALFSPILWVGTPFMYAEKAGQQTRYVAIVYSADDKINYYILGHSIEPLGERAVVEWELVSQCPLPYSEAVLLDADTQWALATACPDPTNQKWLRLAAENGQREAMYTLGHEHEAGTLEKWHWVCLAATQGHAKARHETGHYYETGENPVSQDLVRSYVWYSLAETSGYQEAGTSYKKTDTGMKCCFSDISRREIVAENLAADQITEADRLVAEWDPNPAECDIEAAKSDN